MKLHLGETIRQLRQRDCRTQEELAQALGVSCQAVSRWEKGGAYPDMETVPAIANYFGISIDKLFGYENEREKKIDTLTEKIYELIPILEELETKGSRLAISDVAVAASACKAALESAVMNIYINT